jgi:hypothetical protein
LRGNIDNVTARRIVGWAQNPDHPEAPVCLDVYAGAQLIGKVLANRYRADLARAGLGSGRHAFEFVAPPGVPVDLDAIAISRSIDGVPLPKAMHCKKPPASNA